MPIPTNTLYKLIRITLSIKYEGPNIELEIIRSVIINICINKVNLFLILYVCTFTSDANFEILIY